MEVFLLFVIILLALTPSISAAEAKGYCTFLFHQCTFRAENLVDEDDIKTIIGTHTSGYNDDSITHFYVSGASAGLSAFPTIICRQFKNLQRIEFDDIKLETITSNSFKNCTNLSVSLAHNGIIKNVASDAFRNNKNLVNFHLDRNELTELDADLVKGLSNITTFLLNQNKLLTIPENFFASQKSINELYLYSNKLKSLNSNMFGKNRTISINNFDLENNEIDAIDPTLFDIVKIGTSIDLRNNKCVNMNFGSVTNISAVLPYLQTCFDNWRSTETTEAPPTTLDPNAQFGVCDYHIDPVHGYSCKLSNITFTNESVLIILGDHLSGKSDDDVEAVTLKNSLLSKVPNVIFEKFNNLVYLDISYTRLREIDGETFQSCSNLKWLDISHNQIRNLPGKSFQHCENLETILMENNFITKIEPCESFFDRLKNLKFLSMRLNMCIGENFQGNELHIVAKNRLYRCFSLWFMR